MEAHQTVEQYIAVLEEELVSALGCTEPIAIAYASARAALLLGELPGRMRVLCSGSIIKNVKGVVVPKSGGLKGVGAAAVLGAVGGDSRRQLEVLERVTDAHAEKAKRLLEEPEYCTVGILDEGLDLHIRVTACSAGHTAMVEIGGNHTNIIREELDGAVLLEKERLSERPGESRRHLTVQGILEFADAVELSRVQALLDTQILYNTNIAREGLTGDYGASIGKTLLETYGEDIAVRARAMAAAGSDARMGGCVLPVVINSGSGNQGLTASLPVIEYAKELNVSRELLYRSLLVSNLVAIHLKSGLGRLSAFCGAVSAACGASAAITYMKGGGYAKVGAAITNTLGNVSGIVCDGAKPSCAAKIASSVDAAILGHHMAMNENAFHPGEGLVKESVEETIASVCRMGKDGMRATNREILQIMIEP